MTETERSTTLPRWQPWQRQSWTVVNGASVPFWLAMILFPRSAITGRLARSATPVHAGLGLAYVGLLGRSMTTGRERVDFRDGESVSRALTNPDGMLAAWAHYITFDLFVGQWIHATALEEDLNPRLALLLTWWAGPSGLTLFLWQRRRARRNR